MTTPIPEGGMGEVAVLIEGQRFSGAAREASGGALGRGAPVEVVEMSGTTLVVRSKS